MVNRFIAGEDEASEFELRSDGEETSVEEFLAEGRHTRKAGRGAAATPLSPCDRSFANRLFSSSLSSISRKTTNARDVPVIEGVASSHCNSYLCWTKNRTMSTTTIPTIPHTRIKPWCAPVSCPVMRCA